ncbi:MAG: choice-of-anchor C family protein [Candidatus Anammoximicrobium sp.]|nr:choice-of-anchor C family protein [Candidatus Anammoximicrobium sp.]
MTALSERGNGRVVGRKHRARRKHRSSTLRGRRLRFEALEDRRLLTLYVVDSLGDDTFADGLLTLREAIGAANCNCQVGDAQPGSGADQIRFHPSLAGGTIRLARSSVPFLVAEDLTIVGLGKDQLTIDGDVNGDGTGDTRHVDVNAGATLTMSAMTLTNGYASEGTSGGSIYADGTLVLSDCVLSNSYAGVDGGAIYASSSSPSVSLTDCEVTGSTAFGIGGGIAQQGGSLRIERTEISGNSAGNNGGGIYSSGPLQILDNSQVKDNSAPNYGGGFWAGDALTIRDSVVEKNSAKDGGGGYARNALLAVLADSVFRENTASEDGGAWYSNVYRPLQVSGCLFADNQAGNRGGAAYGVNSAEIRHTRFERNTAGHAGGAIYSGGLLQIAHSVFDANAADWGGALNTWGANTLESCTFTANSAIYGGAINHTTEPLMIGQTTFENNFATAQGGAVRNDSSGIMLNSDFRANRSAGSGGALFTFGDDYHFAVQGCQIEQNEAGTDGSGDGGGIWTSQRRLEVVATTVQDNTTDDIGGGIVVSEGLLVLTDSLVATNTAKNGRAGGIWVGASAELALANTTVSGNASGSGGGGIYFDGNTNVASLVNATISNNRSDFKGTTGQLGGGIYNATGNVLLQNTIVAGNFCGTGSTASDIAGSVDPASTHNLVADVGTAGGLVHGVNQNLIGVDPQLGPLADNGGRSLTHALLTGSPAIDAANNALALRPDGEPLWYDQRGYDFDRLVGLHVDLGAYEYRLPGGELHGRKWFDLDQNGQPDEKVWGMNIVANGSFEEDSTYNLGGLVGLGAGNTTVTGWQVRQAVDWIGSAWTASEGQRSIDLNATAAGAIAQTLITEPGRWYRVQFALAGNPLNDPGLKTLRVTAGDEAAEFTFDTTGRTSTEMGWQTIDWQFRPQQTLTTLVFESLVPTSAGPAIDNVVVQPLGRDDVRIYLDENGNQVFDDGEPLTFLRPDDPNTPAVDETGTYRFTGLPDHFYSVRETLADGLLQEFPEGTGSHNVTISGAQSIYNLNFGNRWDGRISGTKFLDLNNNGIRDRNPLPAASPTVLMVIDVSTSTSRNVGFSVPDMNGNGVANRVIDAELFAMRTLRQELVDLGWGGTAQVGVVVFGSEAVQLDMDPTTAGVQLFAAPLADTDGDGASDVEQVLRSVGTHHAGTTPGVTDFEAALAVAHQSLSTLPPAGPKSLFFVSDGLANSPWSFGDELGLLDALGVHRVGWGFGDICDVSDLRRIDPWAERFTSTTEIVDRATARSRYGAGDGRWLEPGLPGVTIYLDANGNNQLDAGERWTLSQLDNAATPGVDETGWYSFDGLPIGIYTVRENVPFGYVQTAPPFPYEYHVDLRVGPVAAGYDFGNRPTPGCIEGFKGLDADFDGVYESGEPGQAGVTIYLDLNKNGQHDEGEPVAVTNASGQFSFCGLTPGRYVVRERTDEGFEQILPADGEGIIVDVAPGQTVDGLLFVNWDLHGCLEGLKWLDLNGNRARDAGEPGQAGVRIYLDQNGNGRWDAGEPSTWTQADDPDTAAVDETGWWSLCGLMPGTYTVREVSPPGYDPGFPGPDGHVATVLSGKRVSGLQFGNIPQSPFIEGWKFNDCNRNGRRDRNRLQGDQPLLVLTVDLSDSMQNTFGGAAPGDVNSDGFADTVLDGELAALIAVNQELIAQGLDAATSVAIVAFGETAAAQDMDPATPGLQLFTSPSADLDGDGVLDVEQVLRALQREDRTNYNAALQAVADTIAAVNPPPGSANMLFVSDGEPNVLEYGDEVANLGTMQVNLSAFGAGSNATLYTLRMIDPEADLFTGPADLVAKFFGAVTFSPGGTGTPGTGGGGSSVGSACGAGSADGEWLESGVPGVIVYLDDNDNGVRDWTDADGDGQWDPGEGERWTVTQADDPATTDLDETGRYRFDNLAPGVYIVREIVPDGWVWVPPRTVLDDASLVAQLPFRGSAVDAVSGIVADNTGATLARDRFDLDDNAYFFDGNAWMAVDHPDLPRAAAPRTLSVWARSADAQVDDSVDAVACWGIFETSKAFGIAMISNNEWYAYLRQSSFSSGVVADQDWHLLTLTYALTYDGAAVTIYVDGQRAKTASRSLDTGPGPLVLGTGPTFPLTWTFDGMIDDVRIHDRALGDAEVAALYAWEKSRTVIDQGYAVRIGPGDSVTDLNFGNRGTLTVTVADDAVFEANDPDATTGTVTRGGSTEDDLTVLLTSSDTTEATVPATVVIPAGQTSATFVVTAWDDLTADGTQTVTITAAAAGFEEATATLLVMDSGAPGVLVQPVSGLITTEAGGTATFTVVLTAPPRSDVAIDLSSSDDSEGSPSPPRLTFTRDNWNQTQVVTLTGRDDTVDDGHSTYRIIAAPTVSEDLNYHGIDPADVWAVNMDDDTARVAIVFSEDPPAAAEGGAGGAYGVVLQSQPLADVEVLLMPDDQLTVSPGTLTFTPADWDTPQPVTVTAVDDELAEGLHSGRITHTAASDDALYHGIAIGTLTVQVTDNDEPGFVVSPTEGLVTSEAGGTATLTVRLTSQPAAEVTVGLSSSDPDEGTVSPASLTFAAADWSAPQTVTVTGADDWTVDGDVAYTIVTAAAVSDDSNYAGLNPADVSVINLDDDLAGVTVALVDDPLQATEGDSGSVATYTMVLRAQPAATVTITMMPDDQLNVSPTDLTFTAANWNAPQTLTVTAVDDALIEGPHSGQITHAATSGDAHYDGIAVAPVTVEIFDNDAAGFEVVPTSGLATTEAGGSATFTVRLTSQPTAPVSIGLSSSDPAEGTVAPATLTFQPSTWDTLQTVTVTGVDDPFDDGDADYTILTAAAVSDDVNFHGVNSADVSVTNRNDDMAGVTIVQGGGQTWLTEGWSSDIYSLALAAQPRSDVVIAILPDSQLTASPASLTFTADNWNLPQVVRVWAVDDAVAEDSHTGRIEHAASSADPGYDEIPLASLAAEITDNDTAGFVVDPDGGLLTSEAGDQATLTIRLTSQPTEDVIVGVSSSDLTEGTVWPASLTFTAADWNLPQTVTVIGVDDDLHDGDQVYSIVVSPVTSGDAFYHGLQVPDVGVTNLDDNLGWHNRLNPHDVNGDGVVAALDVLIVINYINSHSSDPSLPPPSASPPPYYDVNADGSCTAADVVAVINFINHSKGAPLASGEESAASRCGLTADASVRERDLVMTSSHDSPSDEGNIAWADLDVILPDIAEEIAGVLAAAQIRTPKTRW